MGSSVSPAFIAAMIMAVPLLVAVVGAIAGDLEQGRRDRAEGVVASWAELRITSSHLIMGYHRNAERIPLAGLRASVTETGSTERRCHDRRVHLAIEPGGKTIHRCQPHSYGASTEARKFAVLINLLSRQLHEV